MKILNDIISIVTTYCTFLVLTFLVKTTVDAIKDYKDAKKK